jgi:hypothetical protein
MKMGRPRKLARERQSQIVGVRLTAAERNILERAARKAGLSLSDHVRQVLRLKRNLE